MAYRDVRNFIEMMRALGYPNLISMESFRSPNFPLVANLLLWLAKRFDPDVEISPEIRTEEERVILIRNAAQFMALKAGIKLNTKKVYQADGYAVKELLKIATLLYDALSVDLDQDSQDFSEEALNLRDFDLADKVHDLKLSRQLASEITTAGAGLYDLLEVEGDLRVARLQSMGRQYEIGDVENGIRKSIQEIKTEIDQTKQSIDNIAQTEASLDSKIERRKLEIDRYEKRLQTLKKVRPAFLEEFTVLENELEQLFVQYSLRLRILNQLEKLVGEAEKAQLEKELEMTSPRIETIPLDDNLEDELLVEEVKKHPERPRAGTGGGRARTAAKKVFGAMQPPLSASPSLSSDSEDDDLFIDKDESELMHSEDESLGLDLSNMEGTKRVKTAAGSKAQSNSDDDF